MVLVVSWASLVEGGCLAGVVECCAKRVTVVDSSVVGDCGGVGRLEEEVEGDEGEGLGGREAVDGEEGKVEGKDEGKGVGEDMDEEDGLGFGVGEGLGRGKDGFESLWLASEALGVFSKSGNWFIKGLFGISSKLGKVRSPSWGPKNPVGSSLRPAKALALTTLVGFFRLGSFGKVKPGAPNGNFGGRLDGRGAPSAGRGRGRGGCPVKRP